MEIKDYITLQKMELCCMNKYQSIQKAYEKIVIHRPKNSYLWNFSRFISNDLLIMKV